MISQNTEIFFQINYFFSSSFHMILYAYQIISNNHSKLNSGAFDSSYNHLWPDMFVVVWNSSFESSIVNHSSTSIEGKTTTWHQEIPTMIFFSIVKQYE